MAVPCDQASPDTPEDEKEHKFPGWTEPWMYRGGMKRHSRQCPRCGKVQVEEAPVTGGFWQTVENP